MAYTIVQYNISVLPGRGCTVSVSIVAHSVDACCVSVTGVGKCGPSSYLEAASQPATQPALKPASQSFLKGL